MTTKDRIIVYLYNKTNEIENEKRLMDDSRRYRPMTSLDLYEVMRQDVRVQCWNEFLDDVMKIVINSYPKGTE